MTTIKPARYACTATLGAVFATFLGAAAWSQTLSYQPTEQIGSVGHATMAPSDESGDELPAPLRRQIVSYVSGEAPGTIVIDTGHAFLYLLLGDGKALRYGIGVGREGFTWSGVETISRKTEWPDWIPPTEMIARQPYLPRWVGGGPGNPLGARALYLGNTAYRIHGTNNPASIGQHVSSGCIRLRDADVIDLYDRVGIGTKVVVLPNNERSASINDQAGVRIEGRQDTARMERVSARTPTVAGQLAPRAMLTSNPAPVGLY